MIKATKEEFIKKAQLIHGNRYDYSKVDYVTNHEKVCIICPEHGEFWQRPSGHLRGRACPYCSKRRLTTELFIKKSKEKHGEKYDYSKSEYCGDKKKVCIICPEHGEFWQDPHSHMSGCGCPLCSKTKKPTTSEFIEQAKLIHGDKYDYSKVNYINNITKVSIICPEHGEFSQTPREHLSGCGCQTCGLINRSRVRSLNLNEFIAKAKETHGDTYDYTKTTYSTAKQKVLITCKKHGDFYQEAWSHLSGCGCPQCSSQFSKKENEIYQYVKSLLPDVEIIKNDKKTIWPYELDIYIPNKQIAIEFNGLLWHSEKFNKNKYYHYTKMQMCERFGIQLIQIFEDEYDMHKDIVLSKLRYILGCQRTQKIYARNCVVKNIKFKEAKQFLQEYHIQGYTSATVYVGCFNKDELIGVMQFKKTGTPFYWELNRFATSNKYICIGVASKMLKWFSVEYNPKIIKSFADRRWSNKHKNVYLSMGFVLDKEIGPDYEYYIPQRGVVRFHKFNFRKKILVKNYNLDWSLTEREMCEKIGAYKIWNCGLLKYLYVNPKWSA